MTMCLAGHDNCVDIYGWNQMMLKDDAKNYHAWAYRQWVLETFGGDLWEGELACTDKLLQV